MQNFGSSFWHNIIKPCAICDFRQSNLDIKFQSGQATLNNGFPVMTGKLGQGIYLGGQQYQSTNKANYLTFSRGTQISGNNYTNINTNQGTISFWFKPYWDGDDGKSHYFLCTATNQAVKIHKDSTNNLVFQIYNSGITTPTFITSVSASDWVAGTWYHIVVKWSLSQAVDTSYIATVYVNNVLVASDGGTAETTIVTPTSVMYIGSDYAGNYPLEGILDDFAIWDRVLTTTEITDLYNSGTGKVASTYADSSLKLYLPFDATAAYSGTALGCSAGNMQTGNLVLDGNMETSGTPNWTPGGTGASLSKITSGQLFDLQSLKVTNGAASTTGFALQNITVAEGSTYHFEVWGHIGTNTAWRIILRNFASTVTLVDKSINNSGWTKFETEIQIPSGFGTSLSILLCSLAEAVGDKYVYFDNAIFVANKIANGGFEGTYTSGIAPDWADAGTGTKTEETTIIRTGSKSQKIDYASNGNGIVQASSSFSVNDWIIQSFYSYYTDGAPTFAIYNASQNIGLSASHGINAWGKATKITKLTQTSYSKFFANSNVGGGVCYHDDAFLFVLSSVDITLNYLAQADLFENNGTKVGITLGDQYLSLGTPAQLTRNGAVLVTFIPNGLYNSADRAIIFMQSAGYIRLFMEASTGVLTAQINATTFSVKTFTSNTLWRVRQRIILSWDFDNNIYEAFLDGTKIAGYYSAITAPTIDGTIYIGRHSQLYTNSGNVNVEKLIIFNQALNQNQAYAIDNAYEYAI